MHHRIVDNFIHQLRDGRQGVAAHDELRQLYEEAIEKMKALGDGLYKRARAQMDEHDV